MNKLSEIKKVYINGYARTKSFKNDSRLSEVLRLVDQMVPRCPQRILDVGCGNGVFSGELGRRLRAKEIFSIDISPNAVKEALNRNIKATVLDIDEGYLPFKAGFFDFIFCGSLVEVVLDPDHLLEELYRVLSPNGHLIITFPNLCAWVNRIVMLLGFHPYYDRISRRYDLCKLFIPLTKGDSTGFIRLYTLRSFKQLAQVYGFKVIKSYGASEYSMPKIIALVDRVLSKIPQFAFQIICLAVKE